jgi:hypothetical protein
MSQNEILTSQRKPQCKSFNRSKDFEKSRENKHVMYELNLEAYFLKQVDGLMGENFHSFPIKGNSAHNPMSRGIPRIVFPEVKKPPDCIE